MGRVKYLLDVNALIALTDEDHEHRSLVMQWFDTSGKHDWGICAFTEAALVRISSNPRIGGKTVAAATEILILLANRPGYRYWPVLESWTTIAAPFRERVFGHRQITDAFLLGLAVKEDGVLVTMYKAIRSMAGPRFARHVLVLE